MKEGLIIHGRTTSSINMNTAEADGLNRELYNYGGILLNIQRPYRASAYFIGNTQKGHYSEISGNSVQSQKRGVEITVVTIET